MTSHNYILFKAGGLALAADASSVHCIHDGLTIQPEAGTQAWFLGLTVADERLLPVTDLGVYLKGTKCQGRVIEVARSLGIAGLKIDEVQGVSRNRPEPVDIKHSDANAGSSLHDLTTADKSVTDMVINEIVNNEEVRQFRVINFSSLLRSNRFLNVSREPA